ncbi:MAG: hypothetical protein WCL29_07235, partial [Pseudomonadota bacterium]
MRISLIVSMLVGTLLLLAGCASERTQPVSILGDTPRSQNRQPMVDNDLVGLWSVKNADMAGKPLVMPPDFELRIADHRYG